MVHHIADFQCHSLAQRTADDGSILGKDKHQTAVNSAGTDCHGIAEEHFLLHTEIVATVGEEHVDFFKRTFIKQHVDTLTGGITALGVMFLYRCFTAASHSFGTVLNQSI